MCVNTDSYWAIVVLIASAMNHALISAIMETTGVYHVIFLEAFGGKSGQTALVGSLNFFMFYVTGPVSSLMTQQLGFRVTTIIGGLIGSSGVILSCFARNLEDMILSFGVLTGFGLGITYIPSITIVGHYFTTHRSTAFGFASAGSGVGRMLAPMFLHKIHEHYSWRGVMLIMGAITLNICVCGSLFRQPPDSAFKQEGSEEKPKQTKYQASLSLDSGCESFDIKSNASSDDASDNVFLNDNLLPDPPSDHSALKSSKVFIDENDADVIQPKKSILAKFNAAIEPYQVIFRTLSFWSFGMNNVFFSLGFTVILVHLGAFAATKGLDHHHSSILFSVLGLLTLIGKLTLAVFINRCPWSSTSVYVVCMFICGLGTLFVSFAVTFEEFLVYCIGFGFFTSAWGAVQPSVVLESLPPSLFTQVYGALNVFTAVGSVIGSPLAGCLYDTTLYYPTSFFFGAAVILLSAFVMIQPCIYVHRLSHISNAEEIIPEINIDKMDNLLSHSQDEGIDAEDL